MLQTVYHILRGPDTVYHDLGPNSFDERDRQAVIRRAIRRLETLGYRVTLEPLRPVNRLFQRRVGPTVARWAV